jgi:hypothetical protein
LKGFLVALFLILILSSCEKDVDLRIPDISQKDSFRIDNDISYDLVIEYTFISIDKINSPEQRITGALRPLNDNQVLYMHPKGYLFLRNYDTIKKENNQSSEWSDYSAHLIAINQINGKWDNEWSILSELTSDYFVGFKLRSNSSESIGWLLLSLNKQNGEITLLDREFTTADELTIKK